MRFNQLLLSFILPINILLAQGDRKFTRDITIESYIDFTKSGAQAAYWITYDQNKISAEARYNYDLKRNVSLYAGPLLLFKNWKIRILPGITFGNKTGISFSPTAIFDTKKFYIWNQPQYVIGLDDWPSNFSHWGEFYYKVAKSVWLGITDRYYTDKHTNNFGVGPQVLLTWKDFFITFYWWIPLNKTESKTYVDGGYEHEF